MDRALWRCQNLRSGRIKQWNDFKYGGKTYGLDHLSSFRHEYVQPAKGGKPARIYWFEVEFSLHCFTHGPHKGWVLSDYDSALHYRDSRVTRIFCFRRHALSLRLPDIARSLGTQPCYHTGHGNYFLIELVGEDGERLEYEVYFQVNRVRKGLLKLFIRSAFVRDEDRRQAQPKKRKISFFVIAHNTMVGKTVKMQK